MSDAPAEQPRQVAAFDARAAVRGLPTRPGVYRMLNVDGEVIYVGKAGNLRKRVGSYFGRRPATPKVAAMVAQVGGIEVTVTRSEGEALILENTLIKQLQPRYNVNLRDDKSYPYIYLQGDHDFPRLGFHRGAKSRKGRYFGPYPSAGAVRASLHLLQRLFPVRQCTDTFYRSRTRPCLQYQIERCTAPCVGYVSKADYAEDVRHAVMFLGGRNQQVIEELARQMEAASAALEFERAAALRDKITALRRVQEQDQLDGAVQDMDVVAVSTLHGVAAVQVFFVRGGRNLGDRSFFPRTQGEIDPATVLYAFLGQYYLAHEAPPIVVLSHDVEDHALLEQALSAHAGRKVRLQRAQRGRRARWVKLATTNARLALERRAATASSLQRRFESLQEVLGLETLPQRIECFDVSHTMGEETVASCVVFDVEGAVKSDYRRFNIRDVAAGDDYAAMAQAVERRYARVKAGECKVPDLVLIDGGMGQLERAAQAIEEVQLAGVMLVGVGKGVTRRPGAETLRVHGREGVLDLPPDSPAFHLIQQVRDEAHRFAITGHRQRRARKRSGSVLESIPQLGPKRRRLLLTRFGGLQQISRASAEDLAQVPGISRSLAQAVYDSLHGDSDA